LLAGEGARATPAAARLNVSGVLVVTYNVESS
jgi:hypothetical protein